MGYQAPTRKSFHVLLVINTFTQVFRGAPGLGLVGLGHRKENGAKPQASQSCILGVPHFNSNRATLAFWSKVQFGLRNTALNYSNTNNM